MSTYRVEVIRSGRWWAIEVPDVKGAHSQARHLREVDLMARDVIALMEEIPDDSFDLDVHIRLSDEVQRELDESTALRQQASASQAQASRLVRDAAWRLREQGLPLRDIALVLDVSFQRVKQLLDEAQQKAA